MGKPFPFGEVLEAIDAKADALQLSDAELMRDDLPDLPERLDAAIESLRGALSSDWSPGLRDVLTIALVLRQAIRPVDVPLVPFKPIPRVTP